MKQPIIFCDFDGTITATDNIVSLMRHFAPKEAEAIKENILAQKIGIKDGVEAMFRLLPSTSKEEIITYLQQTAIIREGFQDFVSYAKEHGIPFYVVSGGIDFFVEPLLAPYGPFDGIHCNASDFSGDVIQVVYPYACDELCANFETQGCGCCKPSLIRKLARDDQQIIVIGDSVTDFEAAKLADFVFARDILIQKCVELNVTHKAFANFHDCLTTLQSLTEGNYEHTKNEL